MNTIRNLASTVETLPLRPLDPGSDRGSRSWPEAWQRLGMFSQLWKGWNGAGAVPPDRHTLRFAAEALAGLAAQQLPVPVVNPSPDGAIYAEWHLEGLDLEVIFEKPYVVTVIASDVRGEFDVEDEQQDLSETAEMLRRAMNR